MPSSLDEISSNGWGRQLSPTDNRSAHSRRPRPHRHAVPTLPMELLHHIFDHLRDEPRSLHSCALTCRLWFSASNHWLSRCRTIRLGRSFQWDSFLSTLRDPQRAWSAVEQLQIWEFDRIGSFRSRGSQILLGLGGQLPSLRMLHLRDIEFPQTVHPSVFTACLSMPNVFRLCLDGCHFCAFGAFQRLVCSFPSLGELSIHNTSWRDNPRTPMRVGPGKNLHLRNLSISSDGSGPDGRYAATILRWIQKTPSVLLLDTQRECIHIGCHRWLFLGTGLSALWRSVCMNKNLARTSSRPRRPGSGGLVT